MTHLIQMMPDAKALVRWGASHGFMPGGDLSYAMHAILKACLGDDAPKSFVRLDSYRGYSQPHVLAYSEKSAEELKGAAALFGEPLAMAALGVEGMTSKKMPQIPSGTMLGVDIVTRPVVRSWRGEGDARRSTEHDPYMHAKLTAQGEPLDRTRDEIYVDWIEGRLAEIGADVEGMAVAGRRQVSIARRARPEANVSRLKEVPGQEVTYSGVIRVVDSAAFMAGLAKGVGRHKAFGYGMLVLRPPHQVAKAA